MASKTVKNSHSVICQYLVENSCKCTTTILKVSQIKTFNQKWQNCKEKGFFGNIQDLICGKKSYINFGARRFLSLKNGQMCHQNSFSKFSQKILFFKILENKKIFYIPKYSSSDTLPAPEIFCEVQFVKKISLKFSKNCRILSPKIFQLLCTPLPHINFMKTM